MANFEPISLYSTPLFPSIQTSFPFNLIRQGTVFHFHASLLHTVHSFRKTFTVHRQQFYVSGRVHRWACSSVEPIWNSLPIFCILLPVPPGSCSGCSENDSSVCCLDTLFLSTLTARPRERNENLFQKNIITIISLGHKK